jgi:isoquinoline 1-oxidoreductase alpha subunit
MSAAALVDSGRSINEDEIRSAMNGNLCRCGTYQRVVEAVQLAMQKNKMATS